MMPKMNQRQMQQAMRRMGIQQQEIDAIEVIIRCEDKDIVISNPSVTKVNMMGQKTYQIIGEEEEKERSETIEIDEEDIKMVMEQAEVGRAQAEQAILEANNDLAEAIMKLKKE